MGSGNIWRGGVAYWWGRHSVALFLNVTIGAHERALWGVSRGTGKKIQNREGRIGRHGAIWRGGARQMLM